MKEQVGKYIKYLEQEEKSAATRQQYRRDILCFLQFAENMELTKESAIRYKEHLQANYRAATVNAKIAALNGFFVYIGRNDLRLKQLRIQHSPFRPKEKELSKAEYLRLVEAASRRENEKLSLLSQTICGTGIRVSELRYITAEAVHSGEATICLKGKTRVVLIAGKLKKALKDYLGKLGISSGPIFVTRSGKPLDRSNIWKMMKALCKDAGVDSRKVYPHNLRHVFARCFYAVDKDIAKLADILGHSSVNTTRIYIMSTGWEHRRKMDALGLVV